MSVTIATTQDLTAKEAERLTARIKLKLQAIVENYEAVMPMIREAITRNAHLALGYASPGAYISKEFGDALSQLGLDLRRDVVQELTEAKLSNRDIGAVLGVDERTVRRDRQPSAARAAVDAPATTVGHDGRERRRPTKPEPEHISPSVAERQPGHHATPEERERRIAIVLRLWNEGYGREAICNALGVSHGSVTEDLRVAGIDASARNRLGISNAPVTGRDLRWRDEDLPKLSLVGPTTLPVTSKTLRVPSGACDIASAGQRIASIKLALDDLLGGEVYALSKKDRERLLTVLNEGIERLNQ